MKHCEQLCQQGRIGCVCNGLHTANSDGSPQDETRDAIELALDALLVVLVLVSTTFFVFAAIGFWSAK